MYMHNSAYLLETPMGLWHRDGSPNLGQKTRPYNNQQQKKRIKKKLSTLLYRLTTEWNWNNVKRRTSTSTLLENWKSMEHKGDNYTNWYWCFWYSNKTIIKITGRLESFRTSEDHANDIIIDIGQNSEKSPGDLRRPAVTQTPVTDHRLTLILKYLKE